MKTILFLILSSVCAFAKEPLSVQEVNIDILAHDSVKLKATYYTSDKPGPGMLLLHQCNMDRKSWKQLATTLVQLGIHVLTFDYRGYGETPSVGGYEHLSKDIDSALTMLMAQQKVDKINIGVGGASCGVNNAIGLAKRSNKIKALMLLSGPTTEAGLHYLRNNPQLAIFGAASSEEDFAVTSIKEMVATSTNPASTMKVLNNAGHGTPMFTKDSTLLQSVADWIVLVLR